MMKWRAPPGKSMIERLRQGDKVLALLQERYPEYHPLIGVAEIAHSTDDERLRFDCHKTLCEYVEPKLKSVEVQQRFEEDSMLKVIFEGDFEEVKKPEPPKALDHLDPVDTSPVEELLREPEPEVINLKTGER